MPELTSGPAADPGSYNFMPICIDLRDRQVLMVGAGRVALSKTRRLLPYTTQITVVAPEVREEFRSPEFSALRIVEEAFSEQHLEGVWLMYICTGDHELNHEIKRCAQLHRVLASVCDDPGSCDFVSPAIHRQDGMTIAVSSNGRAASRSVALRDRIRELAGQLFPI